MELLRKNGRSVGYRFVGLADAKHHPFLYLVSRCECRKLCTYLLRLFLIRAS